MLINLLPDFLDILASSNREAAYYRYLESHRAILSAYWGNYVLDLESPHAAEVIATTLRADRTDLKALLQTVKISQQVEEMIERATDTLGIDRPTDVYLMVGVGAANAGELVVNGRGAAVICVTHDPRLEAWADRVIHIEDGVIIDDQRRTPNPDAVLASH